MLIPRTVILLALAWLQSGQEQDTAPRRLTLDDTLGGREGVDFSGSLESIAWAWDGIHLERRADDTVVWEDPATFARTDAQESEESRREKLWRQSLEQEHGYSPPEAERMVARAVTASGAESGITQFQDELWFLTAEGNARRIGGPGPHEVPVPSPDGARVTFVQGGDLFLVSTADGTARRLTEDGSAEVLNGQLDWVYQEEIYGRGNYRGTWWSPDSRSFAFLRLDGTAVDTFTVVDHIPVKLEVERLPYPKAGSANPEATLGVARARDGRITWVDLSRYTGSQYLIVRVGFTPDGKQVVYQVQDREQRWLDLNVADVATGSSRTLLRETSATWVNVLEEPRWLSDGSFLWLSERSGYCHLYHCGADGSVLKQLTSGPWEVRGVEHVDEKAGTVDLEAGKDSAIEQHVYRLTLADGSLRRLTTDAGTHSVSFNGDRSLFLDVWSSVDVSPQVRLCKSDGTVVKVLAQAEIPALEAHGYSRPELFQIPARDGFLMDALMIRPADFSESGIYPVWLATYSGPDAPTVANRWNGSAWYQFLAQEGILVLQVNNRSSSARGKVFVDTCYLALGVGELRDLEDAVRWLTEKPWADASRVGISGWSYGGFMTAYALTHSELFSVGIAGAGVYDWRDYDTIYTERYMQTPQNNPEGYRLTSCVEAAEDLSGHLLLIHGTMDDNVHLQNALQLLYELEKAGKDFDVMLYPRSRHRLAPELRRHHRQTEWNTLREHLLQGNGPSRS